MFSNGGRVRYIEKSEDFPATTIWAGDQLGGLLAQRPSGTLTTLDEADAFRWLKSPDGVTLFAQTLHQVDGFAVTLLVADATRSPDADIRCSRDASFGPSCREFHTCK